MPAGLIHVGANDGREYLFTHGRMVLIEPQRSAYNRLLANFQERSDVTLLNVALGAAPGVAVLNLAEPDDSSSLLIPRKHLELMPEIAFRGTETVPVDTLDNVMAGIEGDFDQMVLDVQGYELEVLKGATETLKGIRWLKCEVNVDEVFTGCALMEEIDEFLFPLGFQRTTTDLHGGCWGDAIYSR